MNKLLLILALVGLTSCMSNVERVRKIEYIKDSRTNLCFATYSFGQSYGTMTNVPCTEEVEKAIKADEVLSNSTAPR